MSCFLVYYLESEQYSSSCFQYNLCRLLPFDYFATASFSNHCFDASILQFCLHQYCNLSDAWRPLDQDSCKFHEFFLEELYKNLDWQLHVWGQDFFALHRLLYHLHQTVCRLKVQELRNLGLSGLREREVYRYYPYLIRTSNFCVSAFGACKYPERGIRFRRIPVAVQDSPIRIRDEPRDLIKSWFEKVYVFSKEVFQFV